MADKKKDDGTEKVIATKVNSTANDVISKMVGTIASQALAKALGEDGKETIVDDVKKSEETSKDAPITAATLTAFGEGLVKAIADSQQKLIGALQKVQETETKDDVKKSDDVEDKKTSDDVKKSAEKDDTKDDAKDKDGKSSEDLIKTAVAEVFKGLGIDPSKSSMRKSYVVASDGKMVKGETIPEDAQNIDIDTITMDEWNALPEATRQAITAREFSSRMSPSV